jgi:Protein of unknown function (DUF4242)
VRDGHARAGGAHATTPALGALLRHEGHTWPSFTKETHMAMFLIERNIDGASDLSPHELADIAAKSNAVVTGLGVPYRWITSYVAGDKIYCVHETDDVATIREHATRGGFPADLVVEIATTIGPDTDPNCCPGGGT